MQYLVLGIIALILFAALGRKMIGVAVMGVGVLLLTSILIVGAALIVIGLLMVIFMPRRREYG